MFTPGFEPVRTVKKRQGDPDQYDDQRIDHYARKKPRYRSETKQQQTRHQHEPRLNRFENAAICKSRADSVAESDSSGRSTPAATRQRRMRGNRSVWRSHFIPLV